MNIKRNNTEPTVAPSVAVVGAGMLGLSIAYRLMQHNIKVTLFESAPRVGGLTETMQIGSLSWDKYYHVTMLSDTELRALLNELDLEHEINWKVTKTLFYTAKGMFPLNNALDYLKLPIMGLIDKIRLGLTIIYASRLETGKVLEQLSAREWLTKLSGANAYQHLWRPLLKAKLGNNYAKVSAAFIWAVIRRFYAARRGGLKTEMFGYVPGGYQRIMAKMTEQMIEQGLVLKTSAAVEQVKLNHDSGLNVSFQNHSAHSLTETLQFDKVILTCPSGQVGQMCPQLSEHEKKQHNDLVYQGIVCPSMLLKRSLGGAYLTYITDDTVPFTAVIEMSSLVAFSDAQDMHLVYLPKYVPSDDILFSYTDEQIKSEFSAALLNMYPSLQESDIVDIHVARSPQVVALSTLNYSDNLPSYKSSVEGVFIINSAQINNASLSVQETVKLANEKVDSLLTIFQSDKVDVQ